MVADLMADRTSSSEWISRDVRSARLAELLSTSRWCVRSARAFGAMNAPSHRRRRGAAGCDVLRPHFAALFLRATLLSGPISRVRFSPHPSVASYVHHSDAVSDRDRPMHSSQLCQFGVCGAARPAAPTLALSRMLSVTSFVRLDLATHEWHLGRIWGSGHCRASNCARPREL